MRIAIVGYGSLIWDLENLSPFVKGDWQMGFGPAMPVEFSRISPKRKKALVLVIDDTLDHLCKTCVIESTRNNIDEAITDLAARERCTSEMIGYVSSCGKSLHFQTSAASWLINSGFDVVIWTALPGNFQIEQSKPFNHKNGLDYLKTLSGDPLAEAWRYIENAPEVTNTPFRSFLSSDPFWQSLDFQRAVS